MLVLYSIPILRTTAAAEVEILVTLVQVLEGGKGVAGGGGGGNHLGSTTVEEEEEWEDSVHFEFLSFTLTAISLSLAGSLKIKLQ